MDLNALRKMARKQREAEEAEDNTAPETTVKRVIPAEEPTADTAIYVPLEDDVVDPLPLPDPFPPQLPKMNRKKKWQRNVTMKHSTK